MTEKFCLKWKDFQSNVTSSISQLRTNINFQDVTLVSDDHKQISAHRVVLTSCSEYFHNVLSQNSHSHPLLCLDGINFLELNNVLDYIYFGELKIYQEDLERFLQIAKKLQLQGLLSTDENEEEEKIEVFEKPTTFDNETLDPVKMDMTQQNKIISMNAKDFQSLEVLDAYIEQQILRIEGEYKCNICDKTSKTSKTNLKQHIEMVHIDGLSFECEFCGKTMRCRNSLRLHYKICNADRSKSEMGMFYLRNINNKIN